ncbi:hypothetical protein GF376_04795 [Candidatus Peregrinibacteria bacterium]|nr:hypothetical protein [Candidatus Peregrinibacteria bacterium]
MFLEKRFLFQEAPDRQPEQQAQKPEGQVEDQRSPDQKATKANNLRLDLSGLAPKLDGPKVDGPTVEQPTQGRYERAETEAQQKARVDAALQDAQKRFASDDSVGDRKFTHNGREYIVHLGPRNDDGQRRISVRQAKG